MKTKNFILFNDYLVKKVYLNTFNLTESSITVIVILCDIAV